MAPIAFSRYKGYREVIKCKRRSRPDRQLAYYKQNCIKCIKRMQRDTRKTTS